MLTGHRRVETRGLPFVGFACVMAIWLLTPLLLADRVAQDAVPFVVAGELVSSDPGAVYATDATDLYDLPPAFARRSCELTPADVECGDVNVAFLSPPQTLPFLDALARLGSGELGILVMRLLGAGALVAGMVVLWRRLAHRTRRAPVLLLATALVLTPFATVPVALGQTSPLLFLSAAMGVGIAERARGRAAFVLVWCATIVTKLVPAAMGVVLVAQRRWRTLAWAAGVLVVLTALTAAFYSVDLFGQFVEATRRTSELTISHHFNRAADGLLRRWWPGFGSAPWPVLLLGLRLAIVAVLGWVGMRRTTDEEQWAFAWLALLFISPLLWGHYLWVVPGAVGLALASRPQLEDRTLALLPGFSLAVSAFATPNVFQGPLPWLQLATLVAALIVVALLPRPDPVASGVARTHTRPQNENVL